MDEQISNQTPASEEVLPEGRQSQTEPAAPEADRAATVPPVFQPIPAEPQPVAAAAAPAYPATKGKRRGFWFAAAVMLLALCTLLAFLAGYWAQGATDNTVFRIPRNGTPTYVVNTTPAGEVMTAAEVIARITPSVVVVTVTIQDPATGRLSGGFGTGVIYATDETSGYILTNAHVVEDAINVSVELYDGTSYPATVRGYDTNSDVAVLKIGTNDLQPAAFGDSSTLVPGAEVIAMGTPYSVNLSYTATKGIVSAIRNNYRFEDLGTTLDLIQHDAAINSGNSGGPLVNMYGQVIGINSIKISGAYENLGFALQINSVIPIVEQIMATGEVTRPIIGITGSTASDVAGVLVAAVTAGGPADQAGLRQGDIITRMDGERITSIDGLLKWLTDKQPGDEVTVTVIRDGESMEFTLTLQASAS